MGADWSGPSGSTAGGKAGPETCANLGVLSFGLSELWVRYLLSIFQHPKNSQPSESRIATTASTIPLAPDRDRDLQKDPENATKGPIGFRNAMRYSHWVFGLARKDTPQEQGISLKVREHHLENIDLTCKFPMRTMKWRSLTCSVLC